MISSAAGSRPTFMEVGDYPAGGFVGELLGFCSVKKARSIHRARG